MIANGIERLKNFIDDAWEEQPGKMPAINPATDNFDKLSAAKRSAAA